MTEVYVGLGSNLGDRPANLARAREALQDLVHHQVCSRVYESEPVGYQAQPRFLNQVVAGETDLKPLALLTRLKGIERQMGRRPSVPQGPRLIDLDLLLYGNWILEIEGLIVPHPRMLERSFVLAPLAEVGPRDARAAIRGDGRRDMETQGIQPGQILGLRAGVLRRCEGPT